MSEIHDYKYHVVQVLDKKYSGPHEYVCVPQSWVQPNDDDDNPVVKVCYPDEEYKNTERRVRKMKKKSSQWKSFFSIVKFSTDSYEAAKSYVLKKINQEKKQKDSNDVAKISSQDEMNYSESTNREKTKLQEKAEETRVKTDNNDLVIFVLESMGWCVSSKSPNTITIKRKAPQEPEKEAPNKRSKVDESDDFEESSSQVNEYGENHLSHTNEDSDVDLVPHDTDTEESNDGHSSDNKQTDNQDISMAKNSWDLEIFTKLAQSEMSPKFYKFISELEKIMGNKMLKQVFNKLFNTDESHSPQKQNTTASAPRVITTESPKLNIQHINEKQPKEKDYLMNFPELKLVLTKLEHENKWKGDNINDNDHREHLQRKSCPKRFKTVTQSPEYVANSCKEINDIRGELKRKCCPKRFENILNPPEFFAIYSNEESADEDKVEQVKKHPKRAKRVVLPPDYDANDSRWTLKYRELKPELVELEEGTGVYIHGARLAHYQEFSKDGKEFARKLLREIFSTSALSTCSWTGSKARAYDRDGTNIRPGLDREARTVLLRYASDYAKMKGWPNSDAQTIIRSIRNKLQKMRP